MSFDSKLLRYCDHREIQEEHFVSSDGVTVHLDLPIANPNDILVRVNGSKWPSSNRIDLLVKDDVTSQVNGSSSNFIVSSIPIVDGSSRNRKATRPHDAIVIVKVTDEDASEQFTGTESFLITQHRRIMSLNDVLATDVLPVDVLVKVDGSPVEVESVEPTLGKIILVNPPPAGSLVLVTYSYKAKTLEVDGAAGRVKIAETPSVGQQVTIAYYKIENDGWTVVSQVSSNIVRSRIIFDRSRHTNNAVVIDEDVSSQITGTNSTFTTKYGNIVPPNAGPEVQAKNILATAVNVRVNDRSVIPVSLDVETGKVDIGFAPSTGSTVLVSYNYRTNVEPDLISVDYSVAQRNCRKCRGTGQLNDLEYDNLGHVVVVSREVKMLQDLRKFITAIQGTNKAHPWYGTTFIKYIGTAKLPEYYIVKFKGEILDSSAKIKDLQNQQTSYQIVDDEEFINFIDNMIVEQSESNPNLYEISVTVVSQALTSIELETDLLFSKPLLSSN